MPSLALAALLLASLLPGCSRGEAAPPAPVAPIPSAHGPAAVGRHRLVFFMNPNGRPCQLQDQILLGLQGELAGAVDVVRYRTTEPGELGWFEAFGIRSLPQLVVVDAEGREVRRATPGIQGPEQVRALLGR